MWPWAVSEQPCVRVKSVTSEVQLCVCVCVRVWMYHLAGQHFVEQNSICPPVYRASIWLICDDLWRKGENKVPEFSLNSNNPAFEKKDIIHCRKTRGIFGQLINQSDKHIWKARRCIWWGPLVLGWVRRDWGFSSVWSCLWRHVKDVWNESSYTYTANAHLISMSIWTTVIVISS